MFAFNRPNEKPEKLDGATFKPFIHNYQYAAPAGRVHLEAHNRAFSKNWTLQDPSYVGGIMYVLLDWWTLVWPLYVQGWKVGLILLLVCVTFSELYSVYMAAVNHVLPMGTDYGQAILAGYSLVLSVKLVFVKRFILAVPIFLTSIVYTWGALWPWIEDNYSMYGVVQDGDVGIQDNWGPVYAFAVGATTSLFVNVPPKKKNYFRTKWFLR